MAKKAAQQNDQDPDFEVALAELERLVEQLESGELTLADSLKHFEQGVRLSRLCHARLDQARQTVELLSRPEDESSAAPFRPAPGNNGSAGTSD